MQYVSTNGNRSMLRFPLVLTYCILGVCIGAYIVKNPDFLALLRDGDTVNYNLAVPKFVLKELPHGVIGLVIVALFSAAMAAEKRATITRPITP